MAIRSFEFCSQIAKFRRAQRIGAQNRCAQAKDKLSCIWMRSSISGRVVMRIARIERRLSKFLIRERGLFCFASFNAALSTRLTAAFRLAKKQMSIMRAVNRAKVLL